MNEAKKEPIEDISELLAHMGKINKKPEQDSGSVEDKPTDPPSEEIQDLLKQMDEISRKGEAKESFADTFRKSQEEYNEKPSPNSFFQAKSDLFKYVDSVGKSTNLDLSRYFVDYVNKMSEEGGVKNDIQLAKQWVKELNKAGFKKFNMRDIRKYWSNQTIPMLEERMKYVVYTDLMNKSEEFEHDPDQLVKYINQKLARKKKRKWWQRAEKVSQADEDLMDLLGRMKKGEARQTVVGDVVEEEVEPMDKMVSYYRELISKKSSKEGFTAQERIDYDLIRVIFQEAIDDLASDPKRRGYLHNLIVSDQQNDQPLKESLEKVLQERFQR